VAGNAEIIGVAVLKETGEGAGEDDPRNTADNEYPEYPFDCSFLPLVSISGAATPCYGVMKPALLVFLQVK
jgi:hypothetical protein